MPGIITALYMVIFGEALGSRIKLENNIDYIIFIIPGLTMMSVIGQSFANSSSSIMQAKYLKFIDDYLIAPVSGFELSMSFIIGAILRGVINGILIILTCALFTSFTIEHYFLSLFLIVVSCAFGAIGVIVGMVQKHGTRLVYGALLYLCLYLCLAAYSGQLICYLNPGHI